MAKIKVELEVPNGNYCDDVNDVYCPMCERNIWGECYCSLFCDELKIDSENGYYCKRCEECKQAEVKDETKS